MEKAPPRLIVSQKLVYSSLKDLGGSAKRSQINNHIREKHPDRSLDTYVAKRLVSLEKKGIVKKVQDKDPQIWKICSDDLINGAV